MGIHTYGTNAVDWEQRLDIDRLRTERLARLRAELERSSLGAVLAFDFTNIRYMTSTHIGTWAVDKLIRFALLVRGGEPIIWDFGSAARHHQLYNPWLDYSRAEIDQTPPRARTTAPPPNGSQRQTGARAGISTLRGAFHPEAGIAEEVARKIKHELENHGLLDEPLGCRRHRAADPRRAAGRRHPGRRRPAGVPRGASDQDHGRDRAAHPGGLHGRRRLRPALRVPAARCPRERVRRPGQQGRSTTWARSSSRA